MEYSEPDESTYNVRLIAKGEMYVQSHAKYTTEGSFVDGVPDGECICTFESNGFVRKCIFKNSEIVSEETIGACRKYDNVSR